MLHKDVLIRLCKARDLLRETEEWLLVPHVAREIGMSPYHFTRLFKAVFGETPKQCQLNARLEKEIGRAHDCCSDLECLLVPHVAREIGMSPYHFTRLFKAVFGETPKQCQLNARLEK